MLFPSSDGDWDGEAVIQDMSHTGVKGTPVGFFPDCLR